MLSFRRAALGPSAQARLKLLSMAVADSRSPVCGLSLEQIKFENGRVFAKASPQKSESFAALLACHQRLPVEANAHAATDRNAEQ